MDELFEALFGSSGEYVSSSAIRTVDYDPEDEELTIQFHNGGVYRYYGVPRRKAEYFIDQSASKGRYFVYRIRNNYVYARL